MALGKQAGDYRRVGPECWEQLMRLYGGGPAIYVDGPPVEDLSRFVRFLLSYRVFYFLNLAQVLLDGSSLRYATYQYLSDVCVFQVTRVRYFVYAPAALQQ